jgi:hypothetical protein
MHSDFSLHHNVETGSLAYMTSCRIYRWKLRIEWPEREADNRTSSNLKVWNAYEQWQMLWIKLFERETDKWASSNIMVWNVYAQRYIYQFLCFFRWFYNCFFFTSLSSVVDFLKFSAPHIFSFSVFYFKFSGSRNFPSSVFDLLESPVYQTFFSLIFHFLVSSITWAFYCSPSCFSAPSRRQKQIYLRKGSHCFLQRWTPSGNNLVSYRWVIHSWTFIWFSTPAKLSFAT